MVRSFITCCFLFVYVNFQVIAQTVSVKNENINVDGKPYALLKQASKGLIKDFSLRTLQGQEIAYAKSHIIQLPNNENFVYYELTFFPEGQKAELEYSLGFTKKLAAQIVQFDLVKENALNREGMRRFMQVNQAKPSARYQQQAFSAQEEPIGYVVNPAENYRPVERNRQMPLFLINGEIQQDHKKIGVVNNSEFAKDGTLIRNYRFTGTNQTQVAVASFKYLTETTCYLVTLKDNKQHQLTIKNVQEAEKELASYLVNLYYL